jgi:hypothetical protein
MLAGARDDCIEGEEELWTVGETGKEGMGSAPLVGEAGFDVLGLGALTTGWFWELVCCGL